MIYHWFHAEALELVDTSELSLNLGPVKILSKDLHTILQEDSSVLVLNVRVATGFVPISPQSIVFTVVMWEGASGKNIVRRSR